MVENLREKWLLKEGESTYLSVRHLCVSGADEQIGNALAQYAQANYGVQRLGKYADAAVARERRSLFETHWPQMAARMRGVERAFRAYGLAGNSDLYDFSALVYDVPPEAEFGQQRSACSAVYIPKACSASGRPIIARNFDAWRVPIESVFPSEPCEREFYSRSFVLEVQPQGGRKVIALGGHDLLCPFQDALNDRGLCITSLADDGRPLIRGQRMAGGDNRVLGGRQLLLWLATTCDDVPAVRDAVANIAINIDVGLHWLIADGQGNAAVLAVNRQGDKFFTPDSANSPLKQPLLVTNHPLYQAGRERASQAAIERNRDFCNYLRRPAQDCTYSDCIDAGWCARFGLDFAYDTFVRMRTLEQAAARHQGPYSVADAARLMGRVACAFQSNDIAGVRRDRNTRTAWSIVTELKPLDRTTGLVDPDQDLVVRFYVDDGSPVKKDANQLHIKTAKYRIRFGFRSRQLWKHKPNPRGDQAQDGAAPAPGINPGSQAPLSPR